MSDIKRYNKVNVSKDPWQEYCEMTEVEDGDYVKFEDHQAKVKELESQLEQIKQQFINYESADEYALDMMVEYERLQTLIMSIKDR